MLGGWLREQLGDQRRCSASATAWCMAAPTSPRRCASTPAVLARLEALCPLAPLHQPHNLAGIRAVAAVQPDLPQVACFDTAFHRAHPELADWFALPRRFYDEGIRRYGFHGLSYEYIASALPEVAPEIAEGRVVVAHLGSGASMCAMQAGRSIDSTMGFTALDGLPMGTRCGALDPGVVLHLIRAYGMDADAIERLLYHDCGLKGVSGHQQRHARPAGERRPARRAGDRAVRLADRPRARRARRRARRARRPGVHGRDRRALGGDPRAGLRARRLARHRARRRPPTGPAGRASRPPASRVAVYAIPTDEEQMIARHTLAVLRRAPTAGAA